MVKKYMLIFALAFSSVQASFAAPWTNFFRSAASKASAFIKNKRHVMKNYIDNSVLLGSVLLGMKIGAAVDAGLYCWQDGYRQTKILKDLDKKSPFVEPQVVTMDDHIVCLNDDPQAKSIIDEVLNTYASKTQDQGKDIKFYYHTGFNRFNQELITACAVSQYKSIQLLGDKSVKAFLDPSHSQHRLIKCTMGHEIGHILNNHKGLGYLQCYVKQATSSGGLFLLALACMRRSMFGVASTVCGKICIDDIAPYVWSRYLEREADEHAIKHTVDPQVLRAESAYYKSEPSWQPKNTIDYYLKATHPLDSERAERFEKAADDLEKRKNKQLQNELMRNTSAWEKAVFSKT